MTGGQGGEEVYEDKQRELETALLPLLMQAGMGKVTRRMAARLQ